VTVGVVEVGVVDTRFAAATLSGRGACVYTCTCVHDNIPCRRLPKYADRRIPTHHKPSARMHGPEGPVHRGWLGVVTCISAASTGGVLVVIIITSGQSYSTTGRIIVAHGRLNGIRQVESVFTSPNTCFGGPGRPDSKSQSRSVQQFFVPLTAQRPYTLQWAALPLKIESSLGRMWTPLVHSHPKRHLDRFSRFCRVHYCDRQTDRQTHHVTRSVIGCI